MREVILYGQMGRLFGRRFKLDVRSVVDVARALGSQLPGFRKYLAEHNYVIVCGPRMKDGWILGPEQVDMRLPAGSIHIVPAVQGAKRGGIGKLIAGLFIAVFAFWAMPALGLGAGILGITSTQIGVFGLALAAGGIAQLLTKNPKKTNTDSKDDSSYTIDGDINVVEQGGPVPLCYGRFMVGSTLISAGITTTDYSVPGGGTSAGIGSTFTNATGAGGSSSTTTAKVGTFRAV